MPTILKSPETGGLFRGTTGQDCRVALCAGRVRIGDCWEGRGPVFVSRGNNRAFTLILIDPCQLAWQVKQVGRLERRAHPSFFPPSPRRGRRRWLRGKKRPVE